MAERPKPTTVFSEAFVLGDVRVVYYADAARKGMLTLRWRAGDNWKRQTLGKPMRWDHRGVPDPELAAFAKAEAAKKALELTGAAPTAAPAPAAEAPLTIGQTWAIVADPETGKWRDDTPYRREIQRALTFAATVWGAERPWTAIGEEQWLQLLRRRLEGLLRRGKRAHRTTIITIQRLETVAAVLRRRRRIPMDAALIPDEWREEVTKDWKALTGSVRDPQPDRPRHSLEEMREILAKAPEVDPRFGLLMGLGAELRLGQVLRCRRSDLDLEAGTLTVHGSGKKAGAVVDLTAGQLAAARAQLAGLLAPLEARRVAGELADYPLFPGGKLVTTPAGLRLGKGAERLVPVHKRWINDCFHEAERLAKIDPVPGRAAYGLRRRGVDAALDEKISERGLMAAGGWSSPKVPNEIYREQENKAGREEAKRVRAKIRGEAS